jgi:hypothetical protein
LSISIEKANDADKNHWNFRPQLQMDILYFVFSNPVFRD